MSGDPKSKVVTPEEIKETVRHMYGEAAQARRGGGCCGSASARNDLVDLAHYSPEQLASLPDDAVAHAYGCGNPLALAGVQPGQVVLDIGSGAGIDVLLAARLVGPTGRVIGLDMTPEMIERARRNAEQAGVANAEFRLGDAEAMPVADSSVDWIVSNCVINLAPDKDKVFGEAFRVLKPGGRLSISDIVTAELPPELRGTLAYWSQCVSGAIAEDDYLATMRRAGFVAANVVSRQHYDAAALRSFIADSLPAHLDRGAVAAILQKWPDLSRRIWSAKITASKP